MEAITKTIKIGRTKNNAPVEIEISFKDGRLSICGNVWNTQSKTNVIAAGQLQRDIINYCNPLNYPNKKLQRIFTIWENWHLNDMKAGTPKQEKAIKDYFSAPDAPRYDYSLARSVLRNANLLIDEGYEYGTAWLKQEVPNEVISFLSAL